MKIAVVFRHLEQYIPMLICFQEILDNNID